MKMKKYLMTGIAALALCVGFTSCSHDLEELTQEEIDALNAKKIVDNYNKAFVSVFGEPAANQDWGFTASGTRTRAIIPEDNNYNLTDQPANNPTAPERPSFRGKVTPTFSATVPNGTPEATSSTSLQENTAYQIKSDDLSFPQNFKNLTFYVVDNVTWSKQVYANENGTTFIVTAGKKLTYTYPEANNVKIYMAPGSELEIGNGVIFGNNAVVYVGRGCTVTFGSTVTFKAASTLVNDGATSFTVNTLNITEGTLFYNDGPLTANTVINVNNMYGDKAAELVNASTITTPAINVIAGGGLYTVSGATTTVNGKTYLYNTNSYFWNDGVYTSEDFELNSIDRVWNTCKLTVHKSDNTGTFKIAGLESHTSFVLDANSSVQTDKVYFGNNADFYMNNNSMLEVLGDCKAYNYNKNHGIIGVGTGYSIFKAGTVTYNTKGQNLMNYYGNVWVDVDAGNHYQQELLDKNNLNEPSDQPTYYFKTGEGRTVKFKFFGDACPITTPIDPKTNPCHHGYGDIPDDPFTAQLRIMAEDLSADDKTDFDFNDIVFDVQYTKFEGQTVKTPAKIRVKAAGGTLPLRIKIGAEADHNDDIATGRGWQEVHALWNKSTGIMINTNADERVNSNVGWDADYDLDPITLDYAVEDAAAAKDIIIEVLKSGQWQPMNAAVGEPAAKFACSPTIQWADERVNLKDNSNFSSWVQGAIDTWNWNNF